MDKLDSYGGGYCGDCWFAQNPKSLDTRKCLKCTRELDMTEKLQSFIHKTVRCTSCFKAECIKKCHCGKDIMGIEYLLYPKLGSKRDTCYACYSS